MGTPAPDLNCSAPAGAGTLRRLGQTVPATVVFAALAATAYWGHTTGWSFTGRSPQPGQPGDQPESPRPTVRLTLADPEGQTEPPIPGRHARIEFASVADVATAGIDITTVWSTALTEQVVAGGEVQFDPVRVARLPARVGGVARRVLKTTGDPVRAGEVVALLEAAEVGKAKAEFQRALVQARFRERERDDLVRASISPAQVREAEAALKEAEVRVLASAQALTNLGLVVTPANYRALTPAEVSRRVRFLGVEDAAAELDPETATANLLPVRSPFEGVILAADVVTGEVAEAGKVLFVVVDPTRVWVTLHVAPEDARRVAVGQKVFFRPDGSTREEPAVVVAVGAVADEATRTVPVRAAADNPAGRLRASTLGRGRVVVREVPKALVVPHDAVHPFRGRSVVFVRDPDFLKPTGPKAFHVRAVKTGGRDDRNTEILAGLANGEVVAVKGGGALLAELGRSHPDR